MSGTTSQTRILERKDLYERQHRIAFASEHLAGLRVLELGCGLGAATSALASTAAHVTGVDADKDAVAQAQALYGNVGAVTFQSAPLDQLPFEDGRFDAVVSFSNLARAGRRGALLEEVRRVLKPEGFALVTLDAKGGTDVDAWQSALAKRFANLAAYGQRMVTGSSLAPLKAKGAGTAPNGPDYRGYRTVLHDANPAKTGPGVVRFGHPASLLYLASNAPLPHIDGPDSIFLMEGVDLWADQSRKGPAAGDPASLAEELQQARTQIAALSDTRDTLERILKGQAESVRDPHPADVSVLGPMIADMAGAAPPADMAELIKLLGQFGAQKAAQDIRLAASRQEVLALTSAKRSLSWELEGLGVEAERQSVLLQEAAALNDKVSAQFVNQIQRQAGLLTELIADLDQVSEREAAATRLYQDLAAKAESLEAQLAESRAVAEALSSERAALAHEVQDLHQSARDAQAARDALELSLAQTVAARDAVQRELIEAGTARDAAEHRKMATLASLQDAVSREQDLQAELARRAEAEARLTSDLTRMARDLQQAQTETLRQTEQVRELELARQAGEARFEAVQQALSDQIRKVSLLEETGRELRRGLDGADQTVETLTARLEQWVETEKALTAEKEALQTALDEARRLWAAEQERLSLERDALERERQALLAERETAKVERARLEDSLALARAEAGARDANLRALNLERQALASEREALLAERDQWVQERGQLTEAAQAATERAEAYAASLKAPWWSRLGRAPLAE